MSRCNHQVATDTYSLNIQSAATQYVYRTQRLDVLEAVGKKFVYLCHIVYFYCRFLLFFNLGTQDVERIGYLVVVLVFLLQRIESCHKFAYLMF